MTNVIYGKYFPENAHKVIVTWQLWSLTKCNPETAKYRERDRDREKMKRFRFEIIAQFLWWQILAINHSLNKHCGDHTHTHTHRMLSVVHCSWFASVFYWRINSVESERQLSGLQLMQLFSSLIYSITTFEWLTKCKMFTSNNTHRLIRIFAHHFLFLIEKSKWEQKSIFCCFCFAHPTNTHI